LLQVNDNLAATNDNLAATNDNLATTNDNLATTNEILLQEFSVLEASTSQQIALRDSHRLLATEFSQLKVKFSSDGKYGLEKITTDDFLRMAELTEQMLKLDSEMIH
jgi:hypothetical protein